MTTKPVTTAQKLAEIIGHQEVFCIESLPEFLDQDFQKKSRFGRGKSSGKDLTDFEAEFSEHFDALFPDCNMDELESWIARSE